MNIWDFIKILVKTEGFSGAIVGLIAVILTYLKVPAEIATAVIGVITVIMAALAGYLATIRARASFHCC
jgi:hypothetical protein